MTDHADHATSGVNASTAGATSANTANAASIDTTSGSAADAGAAASPAAGTTPAAPASHAPHDARLAAVLGTLEATGLSQMLVCDPRSIQYLTGFYVEPGERFLGLLAAAGRKPVLVRNELFPLTEGVSCRVLSFKDGEDPLELVAGACDPALPLRSWSAKPPQGSCCLRSAWTTPARSRTPTNGSACAPPPIRTTPPWRASKNSCAKA